MVKRKKISRDLFLEITNNHLERDNLILKIRLAQSTIENLEKDKRLAMIGKQQTQNELMILEQRHKEFLDEQEKKLGFKIRDKTINPDTLDVTD